MKICWDNLEGIILTKNGNFKNKSNTLLVYGGKCDLCGCDYLMSKRKPTKFCSESCAAIGRKIPNKTKQRISNTLKGREMSDVHREKISTSLSKLFKDKSKCPMYGKKHSEESKLKMSESSIGRKLSDGHKNKLSKLKKELFKDPKNNPMYGKHHTKDTKKKISVSNTGKKHSEESKLKMSESRKGNVPHNYIGVTETSLTSYDTYSDRLILFEEVRRSKEYNNFLEVRCANCGKWFMPKWCIVRNRLASFNGNMKGEHRFYCSDECKEECPIYGQRKYPKGFKHTSHREVDSLVKQLCFERDNWKCQICGATQEEAQLHCHHIEGYTQNPCLGNDIDNVITLCKTCHKEVHKLPGCNYYELQCKKVNNTGVINGY